MKNIWSYVTWVTSYFSLSPVIQDQQLLDGSVTNVISVHNDVTVVNVAAPAVSSSVSVSTSSGQAYTNDHSNMFKGLDYPSFVPDSGSLKWDGFECEYPKMKGWRPCSTSKDRGCWLHNPETGEKFDINTDYERFMPTGIVRNYTLVLEEGNWNADGYMAKGAKLINGTYPGPLIQACWGDKLRVKVINKLKHNGTAMHFHGIRQNQTMHMDGVPGITQCPIAPNDYYIYEFKVTQYGDSWYHSHYSVQYADGLLGPVTIHGPSSANWDEPKAPLLVSDWFHNSAFQVIHDQVPGWPTILLNGVGDISKYVYNDKKIGDYTVTPNAPIPPKYTLTFKRGKKYLLRLINTSFSTTFAFSIDNHTMTVVGIDFVPVKATEKRHTLQIGIGQRYTVIVEADFDFNAPTPPGFKRPLREFWIRTTVVKCFNLAAIGIPEYDKAGIVRYDLSDKWSANPSELSPISQPWPDIPTQCQDEVGFKPVLQWKIPQGAPSNGEDLRRPKKDDPGMELSAHRSTELNRTYPLSNWAFLPDGNISKWNPMQVDYDDPFFLHLNEVNVVNWKPKWMVVPANYTDDDWMFIALTGMNSRKGENSSSGAHPIHLHGHDFAVLQVEVDKPFEPKYFNFTRDNPLRRDVVLLPAKGWVVIGFKTDNPGSWIVHCHIAFHASEGLGFQINERQSDADRIWPNNKTVVGKPGFTTGVLFDDAIVEANRVCKSWKAFEHDCTRHWPGKNETAKCWPACRASEPSEIMYACPDDSAIKDYVFMDDSGV